MGAVFAMAQDNNGTLLAVPASILANGIPVTTGAATAELITAGSIAVAGKVGNALDLDIQVPRQTDGAWRILAQQEWTVTVASAGACRVRNTLEVYRIPGGTGTPVLLGSAEGAAIDTSVAGPGNSVDLMSVNTPAATWAPGDVCRLRYQLEVTTAIAANVLSATFETDPTAGANVVSIDTGSAEFGIGASENII